jgi:hypothetical protein
MRNRRLAYMQYLRCFGEVRVACNNTKQPDPVEVHGDLSWHAGNYKAQKRYPSTGKKAIVSKGLCRLCHIRHENKILDIDTRKN